MSIVTVSLDNIPKALRERDHWVCWQQQESTNNGKQRRCKVPVCPRTGFCAKVSSSETWADFETAVEFAEENRHVISGIGFVFTKDDPFAGIDFDDCLNPLTGELNPEIQSLVSELNSYTEVSPSETGVKCIVQTTERLRGRRNSSLGIEIYSTNRFFTITGDVFQHYREIHDRTDELHRCYARCFPDEMTDRGQSKGAAPYVTPVSDECVLLRARNAKNHEKFNTLWSGSTSLHKGNASNADIALCRILAFWCGPDPSAIDRLFRKSGLYRPKWDTPHFATGETYGEQTIERAVRAQEKKYYKWSDLEIRRYPAAINT